MSIIYIHTIAELQLIGNDPGYPSTGQYELANDIDASSTSAGLGFIPITTFSGELNGAGYTISNLHINRAASPLTYTAIFMETIGATISNLNITDAYIYNVWSYTAILIAECKVTTIENCNINGYVEHTYYGTGGITSVANTSTFSNCTFSGTLKKDDYLYGGGFVAQSTNCTFEDCSVIDLTITSLNDDVGGFVGETNTYNKFTNCIVEDININGFGWTGGLIGRATGDIQISNCHTTGTIIANSTSSRSGFHVGGLIGRNSYNTSSLITDSYSTIDITLSSTSTRHIQYVAGFIGYQERATITNCYSTGNINVWNGSYIAGFIGNYNGGDCTNCYSTGNVTAGGSTYSGGFIGYISAYSNHITKCYSVCDIVGNNIGSSLGGFAGNIPSISSVSYCFFRGTITIDTATNPGNIGGFAGSITASSASVHHCFSYCTLFAPSASTSGGFVGQFSTTFDQCFSMGDVTLNYNWTGGFGGFSSSSNPGSNCYSLCNFNYVGPSIGSTYREVDCQSATDPWCQEIVSSAYYNDYFTSTFSSDGMDIVYIKTPAPDTVYIEDDFPFIDMDVTYKMQYSIYIDFIAKGSGQDSSILSYGIFDAVPALMCGFEIKTYNTGSRVEIIAYNGGLTQTIYDTSNSFDTLFSLKYEKLGVISNFYINDVLMGTIEGQNQSTYSVDALKLSLLGVTGSEWLISKLGFENLSTYTDSTMTNQNSGGMYGFYVFPNLTNCFYAGNITPY